MSGALALPAGVTKEIRALLPTWAACLIVIAAGAVIDSPLISRAALAVYLLGSVALGAASIGSEYTHRTLALLLSQPSPRSRILLIKIGVLAVMVLTLAALAATTLLPPGRAGSHESRPLVFLLIVMVSVFLAPAMTMLARSQLAGTVFTITVPGLLLFSSELIQYAWYGFRSPEVEAAARIAVMRWGLMPICVLAGMAIWPMFARLSAIDGRGSEIHLPDWIGRSEPAGLDVAAIRGQHPFRALFKKELRLQQMSFVVACLFVLTVIAAWLVKRSAPDAPPVPVAALSMLYTGLLAVLIGSLGSAEERQLGTLEWQVLMPVPVWQQWAMKVATTVGLSLLLGVGLPALASMLLSLNDLSPQSWVAMTAAAVILTLWGLYVSSISSSGVRALVSAIPAIAGVSLLPVTITKIAMTIFPPGPLIEHPAAAVVPALALGVTVLLLLVRFGLRNHRSAERSPRTVLTQAAWIVGALTLALALISVV